MYICAPQIFAARPALLFRLLFAPVHWKEQPSARDDGRNYQPKRRYGYYDVDYYGAYRAGTLEYPADEIEIPDTEKSPVNRAQKDEDVRN